MVYIYVYFYVYVYVYVYIVYKAAETPRMPYVACHLPQKSH